MRKKVFFIVLLAIVFWGVSGCMQTEDKAPPPGQEKITPPGDKSEDKNLEADLAQLTKGLLAYNIPLNMTVGETYRGVVSITRSREDSVLFDGLESDKEDFVTEDIQVSAITKVTLKDNASPKNFDIASLHDSDELGTDDSTNTVWKWDITPVNAGNNELHLTATAKIIRFVQGNKVVTYENIEIFNKTITVETTAFITVSMFLQQYWQWLITAIFIPLLGWIINAYFKRKGKSAKK